MSTPTNPTTIKAPPSLNPSPKTRFRESADNISRHKAILETRELERGLDFAKLEFVASLSAGITDNSSAMAAGYMLMGMEQFCHTFRTLTEVPSLVVKRPSDNLATNLS